MYSRLHKVTNRKQEINSLMMWIPDKEINPVIIIPQNRGCSLYSYLYLYYPAF